MTSSSHREEAFGLRPVRTGVTQPQVLQWLDPTFDEAEPALDKWMTGCDREPIEDDEGDET